MRILKVLLISFATILIASCTKEKKNNYVLIEGELTNLPEYVGEIVITTDNTSKTISVVQGIFKDTLNMVEKFSSLRIGDFTSVLFLNNGQHLKITGDGNDLENTITFSGEGSVDNSYLLERDKLTSPIFNKMGEILQYEQAKFDDFLSKFKTDIESLLEKYENLNQTLLNSEKENLEHFMDTMTKEYNRNDGIGELSTGDVSPKFNMENYKGGTTSLADLKGNLVYIDIWATWCMPCRAEIPYLKELEEKFSHKSIKFVSISLDNANTHGAWKQMIEDQAMGGVQLFAGDDTAFVNAYQVNGIPRFILLDKEGKIIDANAPRPSSGMLDHLLEENL